jgi:predicted HicB family RNase H-like nuclease
MVMKEGTRTLSLRIDETTKLRLEMIAHQDGRSVNNLLNFIIQDFINKKDRAKK